MDYLALNLNISQLPASPTLENLRNVIIHLESLDEITNQLTTGIPILAVIQYLFHHIQLNSYKEHKDQLEYDFIQAVATAVLNSNRAEGLTRLQPRVGQVRAIQRIAFRYGDTILVAWTGYGKTIVFQTVSIIMQKTTTIQLCPLKRLGQDQYNALLQIPNARPLLIIDETDKVSIC